MNYRQIRRYLRDFTAKADKLEAAYIPKFEKALNEQFNAFFDYAIQYGLPEALQLINQIITDVPLRAPMRSLYIVEGRRQGLAEQRRLDKLYGNEVKAAYHGYDTKALEWLTNWLSTLTTFYNVYGFLEIVRITETTRDFVRQRVTSGMEEGLTLPQIRDAIMTDEIGRRRANVIARTEVISSLNNANHEAARGSRLKFVKRWSSTHDKRTRHSHVNLDGETVAMDTPFSNGGQYPGDPSLPGKERIQCRCTSISEPLRDAYGRVVRK